MDYEKKYKEALERARVLMDEGCIAVEAGTTTCEYIFPELKESEGEKMKRVIEHILYENYTDAAVIEGVEISEIVTWLEKQGEKTNPYSGVSFECNGHTWGMCARDYGVDISLDGQLFKHLDGQGDDDSMSPKEIAKSIGKSITLSLINYLDNNRYEGAMNMSSMECEDLEKSMLDSDWGKVYRYMQKKLEKQGGKNETNLIEILKHYPRETELYSPLYGKLYLAEVDEKNEIITCYKNRLAEGCTRAILEQEDTVSFYSDGTTGLPDFNVSKDCMLFLYDITNKGVQKPANKIKPKFNVRDWVVYETEEWKKVLQIETLESGCYTFTNGSSSSFAEEQNMRLWTIQDAKNGDVLYSHSSNLIWIYKDKTTYHVSMILDYAKYNCISMNCDIVIPLDAYPATKEQRELLFAKIKEAGYEWDADEKKMKIIDWSKHVKSSITEQTDNENL